MKILLSGKPTLRADSLVRFIPISLVIVAAIVLFTHQIGAESLWLDELNSVKDVTQNPSDFYKGTHLRPLYYLLLMFWMNFGDSDAWLRGLSVIFAVMSVFLLYRLGCRLMGEKEGLIAALLLTLSPEVIGHAQEVRMYALSLCLCLAGTLFLVNALLIERSQQPSRGVLAGWALFRLLAIYTVPLNVILLMPDVLIILLRFRRERTVLISFSKWLLLILLLWSPATFSVVKASAPTSDYAGDHVGAVPPDLAMLVRPLKFLTVWPFAVQDNAIVAFFYKLFTLMVAGLVGASIIRKHKSPTLLWTFAWLVMPVIPIVVFSYLLIPIWKTRYLLFVSPYLFLLVAAGLVRLWRQWRIAAVVMGVSYCVAVSGGLVHYYTAQHRPDYKFNVATIEQFEQPGDAIVWSYECCESGLARYYDGFKRDGSKTFKTPKNIYTPSVGDVKQPEDIQAWIRQFPTNYERWWLVLEPSKLELEIESVIATNYNIEETFNYELGSKVMLLTPIEKVSLRERNSEVKE